MQLLTNALRNALNMDRQNCEKREYEIDDY